MKVLKPVIRVQSVFHVPLKNIQAACQEILSITALLKKSGIYELQYKVSDTVIKLTSLILSACRKVFRYFVGTTFDI